jgi:cytosine/adenosine deaminase-related metal-dependent hydrolase
MEAVEPATLVLTGARVWTGDPARPWAEAVAVAGETILAVGGAEEVARHRGPGTRVLHLPGRFVAPGFIDNHYLCGAPHNLCYGECPVMWIWRVRPSGNAVAGSCGCT